MQQLSADKEKRQSYLLTVIDLKDISYSCQELKQRRIQATIKRLTDQCVGILSDSRDLRYIKIILKFLDISVNFREVDIFESF